MNRAQLFRLIRGGNAPPGEVPVNSTPPAFSGAAVVGSTLTSSTGEYSGDPTSYSYQHQQSDDGSTGWTDVVGAVAATLDIDASLLGKHLRPGTKATNLFGTSSVWAFGEGVGPVVDAPYVESIAPNSQWATTGAFDSGYGEATVEIPTDPTRTTAKAILRPMFLPWKTFADDYLVVFEADAFGGIEKVRIYLEGNYVDVTTPVWTPYTNANGGTSYVWGYQVRVDYAAVMAMHATGDMRLYAEAFPKNEAVQHRVMGPYPLYARAPGVGATNQYDISLTVDPKGAVSAGVSYTTLKAALSYCSAQAKIRPLLRLTRNYDPDDQTTRYQGLPSGGGAGVSPTHNVAANVATLATIAPDVDVNAMFGDDTVTGANPDYDGCHFMAANGGTIVIETTRVATNGSPIFRGASSGSNIFVLEGVELRGGTPVAAGWTGEGAAALRYGNQPSGALWTFNNANPSNVYLIDVNMHDVPAYGFTDIAMSLNSTLTDISGSGVEAVRGAIQGLTMARTDGVHAGLREFRDAFTLTYSGSASVVKFQKTSANGAAGVIRAWEDGVNTFSMTIVNPSTPGPTATSVQDVIDYINANWTNFSASTIGADCRLSAAYLSVSDLKPSYSIGLPSDATATTATPRTIPPEGLALKVIADIHANGIVWNNVSDPGGTTGGFNYENCSMRFIKMYDQVGTGNITIVQGRDIVVANVECQDTSRLYSSASIALGSLSPQVSQIGNPNQHVLVYNLTMTGEGNNIVTSTTAEFDAFCRLENWSVEAFGRSSPVDTSLSPNKILTRTGTVHATCTNSATLSGAAESTMYVDAASIPPDMTPLAPLEWGDGSYAGARAAVATDANQGWNDAT